MIYLAFLFFTFLVLAFAFYQWQHFMVFSPTYHRDDELCDACEILSVTTDDGVELEGVIYEPKNSSKTLLYFGGRRQDSVGVIKKLSLAFVNTRIISFNYRSYGKSGGRISEKVILSDSLFISDIVQRNYGDFYLLGYSLGSNVAAYVASKKSSLGVFLVGSFDSIASLAKEKYVNRGSFPMINLSAAFRYKFRTRKYVEHIDESTYLFVSKSDETTYIQNARNLKEHVKNLVHYKELDNLTHKEILWDTEVIEKIKEVME